MSLVVTSNISQEDNPKFANVFKPYSYQNRLLNTMKIPANSEIALQSAKINKNGLFVLDRTNSNFCHYFGTPIGDGADEVDTLQSSTTQPFRAVIGAGASFRAGDVKNEVNIDDMAVEIEKGIDQATFHPSLITGTTTTGVEVSAKYDTSTQVFEGFKFVSTQQTAKTTRNAASITFTDISENNDYANFTQAAGVLTQTGTSAQGGFYVQNREYPISQNEGECVFNFSDATTGPFMCGLSRINQQREISAVGDYDYLPTYFDDTIGGTLRTGLNPNGRMRYADICILRGRTSGGEAPLRVFQSGHRSQAGAGEGIFMNEIIYYGNHNTNFDAAYDILANTSKFRKVKFKLNNEELSIILIQENGTEVLLCDHTVLAGAGAIKNECLNPINATEWALYPVCHMSGSTNIGKTMTLESIQHYTNYPTYSAAGYVNYDWWGYSQERNLTQFCKDLEQRPWNNYSNNTLLAPKKVNGSGGMADYDSLIITARSLPYGNSTDLCNTQFILGFVGDPISRPTSTNLVTTNESSTVPKLVSNISLFIRLNNFTQNTVNARQGTISKIVAHLPRFDNSGNETGGLYFEPHEKTYLALNNPEEIFVNSFDVDIVYENETLCTALSGKTICCFHIRPQK